MTVTRNKSVILLKSEEADKPQKSKYEETLLSNNYTVITINTLLFDYVNSDCLFSCLVKPEQYSGLVFVSPRCVNAVKIALDKHGEKLNDKWQQYKNYVVGNQTFDLALEKLNVQCVGKDTGNANNLADFIMEFEPLIKPLLVPHGNLKSDILERKLSGHSQLHEILTYRTIASPTIASDFHEAITKLAALPDYVVFFSPSAVSAIYDTLVKLENYNGIKFIAIGPTTALAMREKRLGVFKTLDKPTPDNLLNVL